MVVSIFSFIVLTIIYQHSIALCSISFCVMNTHLHTAESTTYFLHLFYTDSDKTAEKISREEVLLKELYEIVSKREELERQLDAQEQE